MNTRTLLLVFFFLVFAEQKIYGQSFSNELGFVFGPLVFYSDYGERNNFETNSRSIGFGAGLIHYINFSRSADCKCYTLDKFWNNHFKIRNEIDYYKTNFEHRGQWVDPDRTTITADQLRGMKGSTTVFEIGSQLEFSPFSIRDFEARDYILVPFISAGMHWVSYDPEASTDFGNGDISNPANVPEKFINAFNQLQGNTWSFVTSIGARYKLTRNSDLMFDARWQYYFSDWVDGLNPTFEVNNTLQVPENRSNDWIFWLNMGYIYYVD
jgi:hypothetical protein